MKFIPVGRKHETAVDDDFELPPGAYLRKNLLRGGYIEVATGEGKYITRLHRLVMGAKPGEIVDHINGDVNDNRSANLRICTPSESAKNVPSTKKGRKFKCVQAVDSKWQARVHSNGKTYKSPRCATEIEAAQKANELMLLHHGAFARLNIIPS